MLPIDSNRPVSAPQPLVPAPEQAYPVPAEVGPSAPIFPATTLGSPETAFLHALKRRWLLALSLGLIGAALAGASAWFLVPPKYSAEAQIRVAFQNPNGSPGEDFVAYQRTQMAVLTSRAFITRALEQPGVSDLPLVREQKDPVSWLQDSLVVDTTLSPEILRIRLTGNRSDVPDLGPMVNALADAYLTDVARTENAFRDSTLKTMEDNFKRQDEILSGKRNTLKELQQTLGVEDPETVRIRYQTALQKQATVENLLLQAKLDVQQAQAELGISGDKDKASAAGLVPQSAIDEALRQDPVAQKLQTHLAELDEQMAQVQATVAAGSLRDKLLRQPSAERAATLENLSRRRKELQPQLEEEWRSTTESHLKTLQDKEKAFEGQAQELDAEVKRLAAASRPGGKPTAELDQLRQDILRLEDSQTKSSASLQSMKTEPPRQPRAILMQAADGPPIVNLQTQIKLAGMAAFGAFGLIGFVVTWREARVRRVHTVDDINNLGMTVVGTLPALPAHARRLLPGAGAGRDLYWQNLLTESVDAFRTLLLHAAQTEPLHVILVTSASSGEGKTSLASHLAASLARAWRKTLLLDCDLRNPGAHRQFDVPVQPGFCEVLRGEVEVEDVIKPTPVGRLSLIPAGKWDSHAIQALAQEGVRHIFDRLKEQYDFIIIDSSPVLPLADTLLLSQHVDGVLFSVLRDVSRIPTVYAAYKRLATLGIRLLGTVAIGTQGDPGSFGYQYPKKTAL